MSRDWLTPIPSNLSGQDLVAAVNDRLRRISAPPGAMVTRKSPGSVAASAGTGSTTPPPGPPGAEIPNATLTSAAPYYFLAADGTENWQLVTKGIPPADSRFENGQATLCPTAILAAGISAGGPNATLSVTVKPYYPASTCTVSGGVNVTNINPPLPGTAVAGNWAMVNGSLVQVAAYISATAVTLATAVANGTGVSWIGGECRYGGFKAGDTVQIGGQQFTLVTYVQTLDSSGHSAWVLNSNGANVLAQSPGALIWDMTQPPMDPWAGTLLPGAAQAVSPPYPMGSAVAYTAFLVSNSTAGAQNSWPVPGLTPQYGPFIVEAQTTGSLHASRLDSTQIGDGLALVNGKLQSSTLGVSPLPNFDFEYGLTGWTATNCTWSTGTPGPSGPYTGAGYVVLSASAYLGSAFVKTRPGDQWTLDTFVRGYGSPSLPLTIAINWADSTKTYIASSAVTFAGGAADPWTEKTIVATAPANASWVYVSYTVGALGGGQVYAVDHAYLTGVVPVGNGIAVDAGTGDLVFNGSTEFTFAGGVVTMLHVDLSKATNFSTQFSVGSGALTITGIAADVIVAGLLQIGNGKVSEAKFFDGASLYGFIGADSSGYTGAWFKRCGIGGPDPLHPAFFADSSGNVAISGSLISGGTIASSAFVASGTGFTVNIDSTNGVQVTNAAVGSTINLKSGYVQVLDSNGDQGFVYANEAVILSGTAQAKIMAFPSTAVPLYNAGIYMTQSALGNWTASDGTLAFSDGTGGFQLGGLYKRLGGIWKLIG